MALSHRRVRPRCPRSWRPLKDGAWFAACPRLVSHAPRMVRSCSRSHGLAPSQWGQACAVRTRALAVRHGGEDGPKQDHQLHPEAQLGPVMGRLAHGWSFRNIMEPPQGRWVLLPEKVVMYYTYHVYLQRLFGFGFLISNRTISPRRTPARVLLLVKQLASLPQPQFYCGHRRLWANPQVGVDASVYKWRGLAPFRSAWAFPAFRSVHKLVLKQP